MVCGMHVYDVVACFWTQSYHNHERIPTALSCHHLFVVQAFAEIQSQLDEWSKQTVELRVQTQVRPFPSRFLAFGIARVGP